MSAWNITRANLYWGSEHLKDHSIVALPVLFLLSRLALTLASWLIMSALSLLVGSSSCCLPAELELIRAVSLVEVFKYERECRSLFSGKNQRTLVETQEIYSLQTRWLGLHESVKINIEQTNICGQTSALVTEGSLYHWFLINCLPTNL